MQLSRSGKEKKSDYSSNEVRLVRGGKDYFDLVVGLINDAKHTVQLLTYIYEADSTGQKVADALIRAAKRNVAVYVVLDGYASQGLPTKFITSLIDAGIHFRFFEPLIRSKNFYFGRRLHSKLLVIDSISALVGGVNITNRYNDLPGKPAWLDFALFAKGPVAVEACKICWRIWKGFQTHQASVICEPKIELPLLAENESSLVRIRRNDWIRKKLQISNSYLEMFRTAKSHITILSSYALPGNVFRKNLQRAVKRGIKVRMIISGESDVIFVKHAERYWYDWLMRNNIEIYEYTKNVLHGKLAVWDSERMTIGSYNINDLSAYASIEVNFDVVSNQFVKQVENELQAIIDNDCLLVSKEGLANTSGIMTKFGRWFSYHILRTTFNLFTFYYRQEK